MLFRKNTIPTPETENSQKVTPDIPCQKMLSKRESSITDAIEGVNDLLGYMTTLEYVKTMIRDADTQSDMIENAAQGSEESAAATEDISNYVVESHDNIRQTMEETETSLNKVNTAFEQVEHNIQEFDAIQTTFQDVAQETVKINELVNVIKAVADKTNLLSLNASIEAARAGEAGRGFAVVAEEIKKLAENTKEQVTTIRGIVDELNGKIATASDEMERVIGKFADSKDLIDSSTDGMKRINTAMASIDDCFTSISANAQEQTAASEEMSSNLQIISEKSISLKNDTAKIGQVFYDISVKVDDIRLQILSGTENLSSSTMIKLSITDHLMWKWRLYNMILGYVNMEESKAGDHHSCRLGKWLATLDASNPKISALLHKIEAPHAAIHTAAKKAIAAHNSGNTEAAEALLPEIESNSKLVISALQELGHCL